MIAMETAIFTLLHLLVFAYWLGGDLGVFYASRLLTDQTRDRAGRLAAGKIVADVDLVPRFCLLLSLPTGLALGAARGWLSISPVWIGAAFVAALLWIFLVVRLHLSHGASIFLKRADVSLRVIFLAGLVGAAISALSGFLDLPLFLALKLLLLGLAVAMGLIVRIVMQPFGPAFMKLTTVGADPETDRIISTSLKKARPAVIVIWIALISAAFLGVAIPV
ncbi:MAG: hypothetical protein AAFW68_02085 [Pseudomonadota bacterium]